MVKVLFSFLCVGALVLIPVQSSALGTRPEPGPSLRKTLAPLGFSKPALDGRIVRVRRDSDVLEFTTGIRKFTLNGVAILMNAPLLEKRGRYYLAPADVSASLMPLLAPDTLPPLTNLHTVLLDPGHGGEDAGAIGNGDVREKDMVLDIAKRAQALLTSRGIEALLTRNDDATVPLNSRPAMTTARGADLFVSIHLNASANTVAAGVETYVVPSAGFPSTASPDGPTDACPGNRFDAWNMRLAYCVHKAVLARTQAADRGIRRARFVVLRDAPCPAILLECGFLSNPAEKQSIVDPRYRQAIAEAITSAIDALRRSR